MLLLELPVRPQACKLITQSGARCAPPRTPVSLTPELEAIIGNFLTRPGQRLVARGGGQPALARDWLLSNIAQQYGCIYVCMHVCI